MVSATPPSRGETQPDDWISLEAFPSIAGLNDAKSLEEPVTSFNVHEYFPSEQSLEQAKSFLLDQGADLLISSRAGHSMRISRHRAEHLLGTPLERKSLTANGYWSHRSWYERSRSTNDLYPPIHGLRELSLVSPHLYFSSPVPPTVPFHHLRLADLPLLTGAAALHRTGFTGRGIRIALIDSGTWLEHAFYRSSCYKVTTDAAPDCGETPTSDKIGHGTAVLANLLALAPDAEVHAVKAGSNLVCALRRAMERSPDIVCLSAGYDLLPFMEDSIVRPAFIRALEIEVAAATASGTVIVAPVGNGHPAFPGMHPDVISVGGVYFDRSAKLIASDYCSVFQAPWYKNRHCPDICGLSGLHPSAAYIMSPVPVCSQIDRDAWDLTGPSDSWSVIGGSSLSAAHVAGGCALVIQKFGAMAVNELRNLLRRTSSNVENGETNIIRWSGDITPGTYKDTELAFLNLSNIENV